MSQFPPDIQGLCESLFNRFPEHTEMPHFAPGPAFHFAVEVKLGAGVAQNGSPIGKSAAAPQIAEQIDHDDRPEERRRSKRQAADRAQLLFKLAC